MKTRILNLVAALVWLALPTLVQAQYNYTDNGDGTCTIKSYYGSDNVVVIPGTINGLTVTSIGFQAFAVSSIASVTITNSVISIGDDAFDSCFSLTNIMVNASNPAYSSLSGVLFDKAQATLIQFPDGLGGDYVVPNSVTSIRYHAFRSNSSLSGVSIPNSVTSIGDYAFTFCTGLASVNIGNGVTSIGYGVFYGCFSLTSVTVPNSVTSIGHGAFSACTSLTSAYFQGNAPPDDGTAFTYDPATVYYLLGTSGWGSTFGSVLAKLWNPQAKTPGFTGGLFRFNLTGPTNAVIVVEACTNLSNPVWQPVATNTLSGSGTSYFTDPSSGGFLSRYYRFRSP